MIGASRVITSPRSTPTRCDMLLNANALTIPLKDKSVQCVVTSPPYWGLRDFGIDNQLGLESTPEKFVENMVSVFREVWRVLKDDGTVFLNLGDSYAHGKLGGTALNGEWPLHDKGAATKSFSEHAKKGHITAVGNLKPKDLCGIPWRVALALQADGWYLRSDIIWHKPNPMPESVRDRPTKSHEYIFLLSKSKKYFYDADAVRETKAPSTVSDPRNNKNGKRRDRMGGTNLGGPEGGRNKRTVWKIAAKPYSGAHFATFSPELPEICIKAGSAEGDIVLDPFAGSGTTIMVARNLGRQGVGLDLSEDYLQLARERLSLVALEEWEHGKNGDSIIDDLPLFSKV